MKRPSYKTKWQRERRAFLITTAILVLVVLMVIISGWIVRSNQILSPLPDSNIQGFGAIVQTVKAYEEIEVEKVPQCESETCEIIMYIAEKFQDQADEAIAMIRTCENGLFTADRVSGLNVQKSGRRSYDVGIFQVNVDENDIEEMERLKDWKYNIDRAHEKWVAGGNSFYYWTCATKIGQKNYITGK